MLPDQYQASARVYVDTQIILRPVLQGLTVDLNQNARVELITRTLFSRPNLEKIAQITGLDVQAKDSEAYGEVVKTITEKIDFKSIGRERDLYSISYEDRDSQLAKKIVQVVVIVFEKTWSEVPKKVPMLPRNFLEVQI